MEKNKSNLQTPRVFYVLLYNICGQRSHHSLVHKTLHLLIGIELLLGESGLRAIKRYKCIAV